MSECAETSLVVRPKADMVDIYWIFRNDTNVHIAKDVGWFSSYTPFDTHLITNSNAATRIPVLGIGNVTFNIPERSPTEPTAPSSITLHEVLHVPSSTHNILGAPILSRYDIKFDFSNPREGGLYLPNSQLLVRSLPGQHVMTFAMPPPSGLAYHSPPTEITYIPHTSWPADEALKWQIHKVRNTDPKTRRPTSRKYTQEEKNFIRRRFKYESRFLREQGLSVKSEVDRNVGYVILKEMMKKDGGNPR